MSTPILATKLYLPPLRPNAVLRPRLIARLNEGLHGRLTLISAPAGFGKTTLLSEWIVGCKRPVAWLSLDESDNDPSQFLTYLVVALQTIDNHMGAGMLSILQSPQPLPAELVLTSLINAVAEAPQEFLLVLDDYHRIEARPIHDALTFLLDHLPPQMHLAIASRSDPPLPLARLRGRRTLTELRAADLRFTPDEAATFLIQMMGLDLSAADVAALERRTEGWIVGLQMAALSMQGRADTASFIRAFTGSHRFIIDYLVEEVLQRQPERVRDFLLQTSILDRLSGPLCDAVSGQGDGSEMLEALERGNLFVVLLDEERHWYRYHHLFADMLQARLSKEQPDQAHLRHRRASEWYERNSLVADAIRHALAAEDWERAARLVELAWPAMRKSRQEATMLGWVKALPDSLIRARPVLSVVCAWALLDGGELEAAEARLRDAEQWLGTAPDGRERPQALSAEMVVVDDEQFRSLPASIANARAYRAQALDDVPGTVTYARQALELLPEGDNFERGTTAALLGLAYWASGDVEAAYRSFADGLDSLERGGGILIRIGGTVILAHIAVAQGRLHEAERIYKQALQLATAQGEPALQGAAELEMGLAELERERGDLDSARQHLLRGKALREQASLPGFEYLWCVVQALISQSEGDLDGALELLKEAERLFYRSPIPDVRPIAALKARVLVARGRLAEALAWVRARGLSVDDDLSYLREYEHITLARVLIARYRRDRAESAIREAVGLLERLLQAAEAGERAGSAIEILAQLALAHAAQGDVSAALVPLSRALRLAEEGGYVRLFVDEGAPMAHLLREAAAHRITPGYTATLLAACEAGAGTGQPRLPTAPSPQPLAEPLTEREREVLRLLETELSGPQIARELTVGLSTVRTYTKSIYRKLNVNSRRAAVKRASELDLL
jgi:LuxR family maltose regulon positive regulatory protein